MGSAVPAGRINLNAGQRRSADLRRRRFREQLSPSPAMSDNNYLPIGVVSGFNQTLDFGLHGNVHVFTGNGQGMGQIPWAANDPIFWMHHCNIDRIWVSWNNAGHANPNTAGWLGKVFIFAGPDGKGVKAVVKDYTNTKKCDYQYDQLIGPTKQIAAVAESLAPAAAAAPVTVAKTQSGPVALGAAPVRVSLQAATPSVSPAATPAASPLSARLSALPENHRVYLVINDFKADAQPETLFRVYLDLPDGPPSDPLNTLCRILQLFRCGSHGDDTARLRYGAVKLRYHRRRCGSRCQRSVEAPAHRDDRSGENALCRRQMIGNISFVDSSTDERAGGGKRLSLRARGDLPAARAGRPVAGHPRRAGRVAPRCAGAPGACARFG
jgi:hypothetical protein